MFMQYFFFRKCLNVYHVLKMKHDEDVDYVQFDIIKQVFRTLKENFNFKDKSKRFKRDKFALH